MSVYNELPKQAKNMCDEAVQQTVSQSHDNFCRKAREAGVAEFIISAYEKPLLMICASESRENWAEGYLQGCKERNKKEAQMKDFTEEREKVTTAAAECHEAWLVFRQAVFEIMDGKKVEEDGYDEMNRFIGYLLKTYFAVKDYPWAAALELADIHIYDNR